MSLPVKEREVTMPLTLQGGGREEDGLCVEAILNTIVFMKRTNSEGALAWPFRLSNRTLKAAATPW